MRDLVLKNVQARGHAHPAFDGCQPLINRAHVGKGLIDRLGTCTLAQAGGRVARAPPGSAGPQLDHLLPDATEVSAEPDEHLGSNSVALSDQAQQQVLGVDEAVATVYRFPLRQLQRLLRAA